MAREYTAVELIPAVECVRETLVKAFIDAEKIAPLEARAAVIGFPHRLKEVDNVVLLAYTSAILKNFNERSFDLTPATQEAFDRVLAGFDAGNEGATRDDYIRQGLCAYFDRNGLRLNDQGEEEPYKMPCNEILLGDILKASPA